MTSPNVGKITIEASITSDELHDQLKAVSADLAKELSPQVARLQKELGDLNAELDQISGASFADMAEQANKASKETEYVAAATDKVTKAEKQRDQARLTADKAISKRIELQQKANDQRRQQGAVEDKLASDLAFQQRQVLIYLETLKEKQAAVHAAEKGIDEARSKAAKEYAKEVESFRDAQIKAIQELLDNNQKATASTLKDAQRRAKGIIEEDQRVAASRERSAALELNRLQREGDAVKRLDAQRELAEAKEVRRAAAEAKRSLSGAGIGGDILGGLTNLSPRIGGSALSIIALGLLSIAGGAAEASKSLLLLPAAALGAGAALGTLLVATSGFGQALKDLFAGKIDNFNHDVNGLSKNAQQAALAIQQILPVFQDFKNAAQDALFDNSVKWIRGLTASYLPIVHEIVTNIATAFNSGAGQIYSTLIDPGTRATIGEIGRNISAFFNDLAPAVKPLLDAFITIAQVGSESLPSLANGLVGVTEQFNNFIQNAAKTGKLKEWIGEGLESLHGLYLIIKDVAKIFYSLGPVAAKILPYIVGLFDTLANVMTKFPSLIYAIPAAFLAWNAIKGVTKLIINLGLVAGSLGTSLPDAAGKLRTRFGDTFNFMSDSARRATNETRTLNAELSKTGKGSANEGFYNALQARADRRSMQDATGSVPVPSGAPRIPNSPVNSAGLPNPDIAELRRAQTPVGSAGPSVLYSPGPAYVPPVAPPPPPTISGFVRNLPDTSRAAVSRVSDLGTAGLDRAQASISSLTNSLQTVIPRSSAAASQALANVGPALRRGVDGTTAGLGSLLRSLDTGIPSAASRASGAIKSGFSNVSSAIGGLSGLLGGVAGLLGTIGVGFAVDAIIGQNQKSSDAVNGFKDALNNTRDAQLELNNAMLASGGAPTDAVVTGSQNRIQALLGEINANSKDKSSFLDPIKDKNGSILGNIENNIKGLFSGDNLFGGNFDLSNTRAGQNADDAKSNQDQADLLKSRFGSDLKTLTPQVLGDQAGFDALYKSLANTSDAGQKVADKLKDVRKEVLGNQAVAAEAQPVFSKLGGDVIQTAADLKTALLAVPKDIPINVHQDGGQKIFDTLVALHQQVDQLPDGTIHLSAPLAPDVQKALDTLGVHIRELPDGKIHVEVDQPSVNTANNQLSTFFDQWKNQVIAPQVKLPGQAGFVPGQTLPPLPNPPVGAPGTPAPNVLPPGAPLPNPAVLPPNNGPIPLPDDPINPATGNKYTQQEKKDAAEAGIDPKDFQVNPWANQPGAPNVTNGALQVQVTNLPATGALAGLPTAVPGGGYPGVAGAAPSGLSGSDPASIAQYIAQKAMAAGYGSDEAKAFVQQALGESSLSPTNVGANTGDASGAAQGIFQFTPGTAKDFGLANPLDAQQNIDAYFRLAAARDPKVGDIQSRLAAISGGGPAASGTLGTFADQATKLLGSVTAALPSAAPAVQTPGGASQSLLGSPVVAGPHTQDLHGGVVPRTADLEAIIKANFPGVTILNDTRPPDGFDEHSSGEAVDLGINPGGKLGVTTPEGQALGEQVRAFLIQNSKALGLQYGLFDQQQFNPDGSVSDMENRGGVTANHGDHVHARVFPGADGGGPAAGALGSIPALGLKDNLYAQNGPLQQDPVTGEKGYFQVDTQAVNDQIQKINDNGAKLSKDSYELAKVIADQKVNLATEQDVIDARQKLADDEAANTKDLADLTEKQRGTFKQQQQLNYDQLPFGDPRKIFAAAIGGAGGSQQDIQALVPLLTGGNADGGVLPGYSPKVDNLLVPMSGGEGVIIPEAMRALGGAWLHGLNSSYRRGISRKGYADGGVIGSGPGAGPLPGPQIPTLLTQIRDVLSANTPRSVAGVPSVPSSSGPMTRNVTPGIAALDLLTPGISAAAGPIGQFAGDLTTNALAGADILGTGGGSRAGGYSLGTAVSPSTNINKLVKERNPLALAAAAGYDVPDYTRQGSGANDTRGTKNLTLNGGPPTDALGRIYSDTAALIDRTATDKQAVQKAQFDQTLSVSKQIYGQVSSKVVGPTVQASVTGGINGISDTIKKDLGVQIGTAAAGPIADAVSAQSSSSSSGAGESLVNTGANSISGVLGGISGVTGFASVDGLPGGTGPLFSGGVIGNLYDEGGLWPSGTYGTNLSGHDERVLNPRETSLFDAGLLGGWRGQPEQQHFASANGVDVSSTVGADFFGVAQIPLIGTIVNLLVSVLLKVIGVTITARNTLTDISKNFVAFRGDFKAFDASGRLYNDTSALTDRNSSSEDEAAAERLRILKVVIQGLIKFIIDKLIIPITTAIFQALINAGASAAGGAIGASFPGGSIVGGAVSSGLSSAGDAFVQIGEQIFGDFANAFSEVAINAVGEGLQSYFPNILQTLLGGSFFQNLLAAPLTGFLAPLLGLFGAASSALPFDDGGLAAGVGWMPKATIRPERVLNPRETQAFESWMRAGARADGAGNITNVTTGDIHLHGTDATPEGVSTKLLSLANV